MRILSQQEVFHALQYARSIPEAEGARILKNFQAEEPALCEMLFIGLPQAIAQQDQGLAHLFMDLCFDILCVYRRTLGDMPQGVADRKWLSNKMEALQKDFLVEQPKKSAKSVQTVQNTDGSGPAVQDSLLEYLHMAIHENTKGDPSKDQASIIVANFLFVVTRLLDGLYDETPRIQH